MGPYSPDFRGAPTFDCPSFFTTSISVEARRSPPLVFDALTAAFSLSVGNFIEKGARKLALSASAFHPVCVCVCCSVDLAIDKF